MRAGLPIAAVLGLAGCAPTVAARPAAEAGPVPVTVEGRAFAAEIHGGRPGLRLTPGGALPSVGLAVTVAADDGRAVRDFAGAPLAPGAAPMAAPPLGPGDGRIAKGAARAACAAGGGRFDEGAIGRVSGAGRWTFEGACS